jgi:hypothetical protein
MGKKREDKRKIKECFQSSMNLREMYAYRPEQIMHSLVKVARIMRARRGWEEKA